MKIILLLSALILVNASAITLPSTSSQNSLIVYNSNVGLVHEKRELKLQKNDRQIIYTGVASSINTDSVNVSLPSGISLYSQQYRYDKLSKAKLIDAHIGKSVQVKVAKDAKNFKVIDAVLLSNDGNSCIVKSENKIITVASKDIIFKSIPKELITKPSLVWNIKSKKNINSDLTIDYLINNISWKSNYILNLDGDNADLNGWITLDNRSGKSFKNTSLHVLAGELNRAQQPRHNYRVAKSMVMNDSMQGVTQQAHEGYHFYTIPFKVTLANNERTQIKFITQRDIPVKRKYTVTMSNPNYLRGESSRDVTQFISMKGLEYPLPSGIVRTYSKLEKTTILLGETRIKHTPKDTAISLKLGKNFDVKVKETLLNRDKGNWKLDVDAQYSIKNSSDETKDIEILIPFNKNDGSEVKSDVKYTFTKGNMVTFKLRVKANSTKKFKVFYRTKIKN
ncbi:MAG: hypothetical protein Q9M32_00825 [Sulfurimonas sp.]|nr:hypothetical protein [Sulfurimonas sp.]MDQ7060992.1 hypothetical protein [Sulfurimonas sp.]